LPFSPFCDPLVDSCETFNKLLDSVLAEGKKLKASYLELRILKSFDLLNIDAFKESFSCFLKTYRLPLEGGPAMLRKSFHKTSIQQRIRKAERELKIRVGRTEKDMKDFYNLYVLVSSKKHGFPPKPFRFFQNMLKYMLPSNLMTLLIAEYKDRTIGGIVLLKFKDVIHSEYLASDMDFLKYHPNHLLIWKAIEMGCGEGFRYFDFGRAGGNMKGLIEFKEKWGGDECEVPYMYFPKTAGITSLWADSKRISLSNKVIPRLPVALTKAVGSMLYNYV
jgi:lipid II:glycine glycyltransferase (peptidoglycan interpeptide bridge formation enzyme)